MGVKLIALVGVTLVTSWFLINAYLCVTDSKVWGDEFYRSYLRFHTWFQRKHARKIA